VAEALGQLAEAHGLERIVLAGDTRNVSALRAHLPPRMADRVAGTIAGARYEAAAALAGRAQELVGHVEEFEDTDAVDTVLTEAAKSGRAVAGLEATLEAVRRGAVHRLYLLKAFADSGRVCDGCGALQSGPGERCRLCGAGTRPVDLGSAMVERVLAAGGRVETIDTHGGLARVGGVAARVRYPL
jgi:peptide subunit release factor 1 (eRF1)